MSFGLSALYTSSKAEVISAVHIPEVAISRQLLQKFYQVSRLCHVMDTSPTDNYIPIYIDPL